MLKFCSPSSKTSLLTHIFSIKINKNENKNEIIVHQLYPKGEDQDLIPKVKLFACPQPSSLESHCFFHFIVGDIASGFRIGFVQYETIYDGRCVISDYYYPRIFSKLMSLHPDDQMIRVAEQLSAERQRESILFIDDNDNSKTKYSLDGKYEEKRLIDLFFKTFSPFDISKIIIGMLQARHIFVVASNVSVCSDFAGLSLLIKPFKWSLNIVPILPDGLSDMLEVPIPILIGTTRSEALYAPGVSIASHICVNPDAKIVIESSNYEDNVDIKMKILKLQMEFHNNVSAYLKNWSGCSNFPTDRIFDFIADFIRSYLQAYGANLNSKNDFIRSLQSLPQFLSNSQIIQDFITNDDEEVNSFYTSSNKLSAATTRLSISSRLNNGTQEIHIKTKSKIGKMTKSSSLCENNQNNTTNKFGRHSSSLSILSPKISVSTNPQNEALSSNTKSTSSYVQFNNVSSSNKANNPSNTIKNNKQTQDKIQTRQKTRANTPPKSEKKFGFNIFKNKNSDNTEKTQNNQEKVLQEQKPIKEQIKFKYVHKEYVKESARANPNHGNINFRNSVSIPQNKSTGFQEKLAFYNSSQK